MTKEQLDATIDRVLREAAMDGDDDALLAWRIRHGYPAYPTYPRGRRAEDVNILDDRWTPVT